jgi:hypothetical protein
MFIQALNRNLDLQRYRVLYVTGNYSRVLTHLSRRFTELEIRRGFTVFQLMIILDQARHSLILIKHDPMLYEDAREMAEYVSQAMIQALRMLRCCFMPPAWTPIFEEMVQDTDRRGTSTKRRGPSPDCFQGQSQGAKQPEKPGGLHMR